MTVLVDHGCGRANVVLLRSHSGSKELGMHSVNMLADSDGRCLKILAGAAVHGAAQVAAFWLLACSMWHVCGACKTIYQALHSVFDARCCVA